MGSATFIDDDYGELTPRWRSPARIAVDGSQIVAVPVEGGAWQLIPWFDSAEPELAFKPLVVFGWDSETYTAVGNAGSRSVGLYQVTGNLYAEIEAGDGRQVPFHRSSVSRRVLVRDFVTRYGAEHLHRAYADLMPARSRSGLGEDLPGDWTTCQLDPAAVR